MKITAKTEEKIKKVNLAIDNGSDLAMIKKTLFSGHNKKCIEYLEKYSDYIPHLDKLLKPQNEIIVKREEPLAQINPKTINDLMELLHYKEELIKIVTGNNPSNYNQTEDILTIPNEYLKMKNLQMKSFRIEKELFEEFDDICNNNSLYTKTSIINYMIYEFVQRYKK